MGAMRAPFRYMLSLLVLLHGLALPLHVIVHHSGPTSVVRGGCCSSAAEACVDEADAHGHAHAHGHSHSHSHPHPSNPEPGDDSHDHGDCQTCVLLGLSGALRLEAPWSDAVELSGLAVFASTGRIDSVTRTPLRARGPPHLIL